MAKAVRFLEELNCTLEFENDSLLDPESVWYQPEHYVEMKARSRSDARDARKQGMSCLLTNSFDSPRPDTQVRLNALAMMKDESECRRGLERFLSRDHGDERIDGKDRARSTVLIHQARLKQENVSVDETMESLATVYTQAVAAAFVFARRLGIADELVVQEGEDSTVAHEYMKAHLKHKRQRNNTTKMERRQSNSNKSVQSQQSTDSRQSQQSMDSRKHQRVPFFRQGKFFSPVSPSSPSEEFYASIA